MMFTFLAVMMTLVIVMTRVRSMVMPGMGFVVRVNDHRGHPSAPNRIKCDTQHHQNTQAHHAGKPRRV